MTVFLVREESVPVERLEPGDRLILPTGARVTVEYVQEIDGRWFVRWWRPALRGEPGHPGGKDHRLVASDAYDGRYLGSTIGVPAGTCWSVDRGE